MMISMTLSGVIQDTRSEISSSYHWNEAFSHYGMTVDIFVDLFIKEMKWGSGRSTRDRRVYLNFDLVQILVEAETSKSNSWNNSLKTEGKTEYIPYGQSPNLAFNFDIAKLRHYLWRQ